MMNRIVGILITQDKYESIKNGSISSSFQQYELAAKNYGITVCFFSDEYPYESNEIKVLMKNESINYSELAIKIPKVIYNQVSLSNKKARENLHKYIKAGANVFNVIPSRNSKYEVHKMLQQNISIRNHLPATVAGSKSNLNKVMAMWDRFFIKPCFSSLGKGIIYFENHPKLGWIMYQKDPLTKSWEQLSFTIIEKKKIERLLEHRAFIIQEKILLATFKDRPYDIRVIVQKNGEGNWQITGKIAKLAPVGHLITNVGGGGELGTLEQYLAHGNFSSSEVDIHINSLSLNVASSLEKSWPHIADLGLDIGIDNQGKPFFIECNLRGRYNSIKKHQEFLPLWKKIHDTPITYINYLLETK